MRTLRELGGPKLGRRKSFKNNNLRTREVCQEKCFPTSKSRKNKGLKGIFFVKRKYFRHKLFLKER